ncbi:hypothetical protein NEICINOT_04532 [Neisseria cinerea ATCC 14685]|uniref:Uncharacterized protein n=1 Tax=Neisseria cinerea ATCC 14685 TaxID=546262 RepID=D0W4D5_NEICI|nr:hypothetical protein NEICINOT_04532 [Neisseria cinerea ATCC 14685]
MFQLPAELAGKHFLKRRFPFSDGIRYRQFHPSGIVFDFMRYLSDTAFFKYQLSDLQR